MGMDTGKDIGAERDCWSGRNGTENGKMGRPVQVGQAAEYGDEKASVGGGCIGVPELLRGGGCQLGSAPITFGTEETGG